MAASASWTERIYVVQYIWKCVQFDYGFLSPPLSTKLVSAMHSQEDRLSAISDHIPLILEIDLR